MNLAKLPELVATGVVCERSHKSLPLKLYNYSARCQYEKLWCETSLQCRGLVLHGNEIVARPFPKFFNDTEHPPGGVPWHLPCVVTEKMDGSLLIVFHFDGQWHAATRGSFDSHQAVRGLQILREKYSHVLPVMDITKTYLFELLATWNRIVVDYGVREDVVLIGMFETNSGAELPLETAPPGLTVVRRLPPTADARELRSLIRDDEEGYVVRFENGFRVKVKGERYMQLHRILANVSSRMVWENLSQGRSFDDVLAVVPDEFAQWVLREKTAQEQKYDAILQRAAEAVDGAAKLPTRKQQALYILASYKDVSGAAFSLLDGKDASQGIWKELYPAFRIPQRLAEMDL